MISLFICVLLIGLMLLGVPIAAAMGFTSVCVFAFLGESQNLTVMPQRVFVGTTNLTMLAIPFFILAGNLMNTGGITDRVFRFAQACCGHWPGGLAQVNIASSVIFSGMSGAAIADAAGIGLIEMKAMTSAGFDKRFAAGITAASATIGPVIPPSIPLVVYASITGVSVGALFMAGVIPGLLMAVAMGVAVFFISRARHYPVEIKMSFRERFRAFVDAIPSLLAVVIILGGIWGGTFTPTEAAVVATAYALFLGVVVYKELKLKDLLTVVKQSLFQSGMTLFIIAVANFFAYFLMHQRIPNQIISAITTITSDPHGQVMLIIGILLILGCFMEGVAVILIVTPIFMPIVMGIGMNPVQFGIVLILASMVGLLTPPVGMCLYAISSVSKVDVISLSVEVWPYLLGIFLVMLLAAFWPPLSLWLPSILM
jgi:tripartite ATP-independent transporter DctM subunit